MSDYNEMTSGGFFLEFRRAAGNPDVSIEAGHHAGVRKLPDGTLKYWAHWGSMDTADFRLNNPNVMWFDDAKEAYDWLIACWRMR